MTDREKAITELESIQKSFDEGYGVALTHKSELIRDILGLLKEQNIRRDGRWKSIPHKKARVCSVCEKDEPYKFADDEADVYAYCPHCGAKMEEQTRT